MHILSTFIRIRDRTKYKTISEIPIYWLVAAGVSVYFITILLFSGVYHCFSLICSVECKSFPEFLDILYFSVVTQTTLGYGDFLPVSKAGRLVVIIQVTTGILEFSLLAGYFLTRFFWPTNVVRFSKYVAFLPDQGVFKVRVVNMNSFELSKIEVGLWKNIRKEDGYSNMPISLVYKDILCMSSMSPWKIKSRPVPEDEVKDIFLNINKFYFQISGSFIHSSYVRTKIYSKELIVCGDFKSVKKTTTPLSEYKKLNWNVFDEINDKKQEDCSSCGYINECICINKCT